MIRIFAIGIVLLLGMAYLVRTSVDVSMHYTIEGDYLDVANLHMNIEKYSEYTNGQVLDGNIYDIEQGNDSHGNRTTRFKYILYGSFSNNYGGRTYTFFPQKAEVVAEVSSYTEILRETNRIRWVIRQDADMVSVSVSGTRTVPLLVYPFVQFHNTNARNMLENIERRLNNA